jgi:hypothetical protein
MKKVLFFVLITLTLSTQAQNIQILLNTDINFVTFELYKPLKTGPIYYFTDFKIDNNGYFETYSEISKYWNIKDIFAITIQGNAGLNKDFQIKPVYLGGLSKTFIFNDNFTLTSDFLYHYQTELITDAEKSWGHSGFQVTISFCNDLKKFQMSGYCDYWNVTYYIFEPQIWYKLFKQLYIGAEGRISNYSILDNYQTYIMAGIKWNLEQ